MKSAVKLYIATSNYLINQGMKAVFAAESDVEIVGIGLSGEQMVSDITELDPAVMIVDYEAGAFSERDVVAAMKARPKMKVVAITSHCDVPVVKKLLDAGLNGHLMSDCDHEEIVGSVRSSMQGERFFCGKVLDRLNASEGEASQHGCDPVSISERELEILNMVAQGLTTKQIAEKLHLSFHTVMTHRKNMMNKLGINNTAGLIIYAVKENLISPNKFLFS